MTDYLVVHDAAQSGWFWNKVWGYMTAPVEHPPCLYRHRNAASNVLLNLPGHGIDVEGDSTEVQFDECVHAITSAVERRSLRNLVLVGHGLGGLLALQAAPLLPTPPRRLVLLAGLVPVANRSILSLYPGHARRQFSAAFRLGRLLGREQRLSPSFVARQLCNGMEPRAINQSIGFFGPVPRKVLESRQEFEPGEVPCPVSYVVLDQNRLIPPRLQLSMADRLTGADRVHLDSCHQAQLHKPREVADILLRYS